MKREIAQLICVAILATFIGMLYAAGQQALADMSQQRHALTFELNIGDGVQLPSISFCNLGGNVTDEVNQGCMMTPGGPGLNIILDLPVIRPNVDPEYQTTATAVLAPLSSIAPGQPYVPIRTYPRGGDSGPPVVTPDEPPPPVVVSEPPTWTIWLFGVIFLVLLFQCWAMYTDKVRMKPCRCDEGCL